jgi:hypothetical protein
VPRLLAVINNIICVSDDEASIHMFEFSLILGGIWLSYIEWKAVPNHNKTADHTETVISLCAIKNVGIFD